MFWESNIIVSSYFRHYLHFTWLIITFIIQMNYWVEHTQREIIQIVLFLLNLHDIKQDMDGNILFKMIIIMNLIYSFSFFVQL